MATILIVHRIDDAHSESGRLFDWLERALPGTNIATNVEGIVPNGGQPLRDLLSATTLVLAVIGRSWLAPRHQRASHLDDHEDSVRFAIECAFHARIPVIPVLVQGAQMPSAMELPPTLTPLSTASAIHVRHLRWADDVAYLINRIEVALSEQGRGEPQRSQTPPTRLRRWQAFPAQAGARLERLRRRVVPRSRHWQAIKRVTAVAVMVAMAIAIYSGYRYVAAADLRRVQKIAAELTYETPIEMASGRLRELHEIVAAAKDRAVINATVETLKALVKEHSKTSADARRIRREAIELLKAIRQNDLSSVFAKGELVHSDFHRVNLSSAVLRGVSLEGARLVAVKFVDADLSGADLSSAYVIYSDFTNANLSGANLHELDWYNARGFVEAQLQKVQLETLERCPRDASSAHSFTALQAKLVRDYGAPWEKFTERDRTTLTTLWEEYAKPDGLCDVVDRWPK